MFQPKLIFFNYYLKLCKNRNHNQILNFPLLNITINIDSLLEWILAIDSNTLTLFEFTIRDLWIEEALMKLEMKLIISKNLHKSTNTLMLKATNC